MTYDFRKGDKIKLKPELVDDPEYNHWGERYATFTVSRVEGDKVYFEDLGGFMYCSVMCLIAPRIKTRPVLEILNGKI